MPIEGLVDSGGIHPFKATRDEVESLDWSYSIAYNAVLQACRAYMFKLGYRPASIEAHKTTFEFMQFVVEEPYRKSISYFDRVRKKRHRTVYDEVGWLVRKRQKNCSRGRGSSYLTWRTR